MYYFGKSSNQRKETLHPDLQKIMDEAIKIFNFSIVCGHRGEEEQNKAVAAGNSQKKYPDSKHNKLPSLAVDIVPWPTQYQDIKLVYMLAGIIKATAYKLGIKIRWGGDWDGDGDITDQHLHDPYHFELV